jgi:hypothetical protein
MKYSDFLVYNDNLKNATIGNWKNDNIIKNKDRFMRWYDQSLILFSSEINKSTKQIIKEAELQKDDKIIWVKDLPKNILNEYKKQIQENK